MQLSLLYPFIATAIAAIPRETAGVPWPVQNSALGQNTPSTSVAAIAQVSERSSLLTGPSSAPSANTGHASAHVVMSISMLPVATSAHSTLAAEPATQRPLHGSERKKGHVKANVLHVTASVVQRDADQMVIDYPLTNIELPPSLPRSLQTSSAKPSIHKSSTKPSKPSAIVAAPAPTHTPASKVVQAKPSTGNKARASVKNHARYSNSALPTTQPSVYSKSAQLVSSAATAPTVVSTGYAKPTPPSASDGLSTTTSVSPSPSPTSTAIAPSKYGSRQEPTTSTPIGSALPLSSTLAEPEPLAATLSSSSSELQPSSSPPVVSSQPLGTPAAISTGSVSSPTVGYTGTTQSPSPQLSASPTGTSAVPGPNSYSAHSPVTALLSSSEAQPASVSGALPSSTHSTSIMPSPSPSATSPVSTATPSATTASASPASSSAPVQTYAASHPPAASSGNLPTHTSEAPTKTVPVYSASDFTTSATRSQASTQPSYLPEVPISTSMASSPSQYSATPMPTHASKMDISVNLRFTIDCEGEQNKAVITELDQANAALSARVVYESADSSSYSSTTTKTITVYPTFVPVSLKGYSDSSDSAATVRRNHYHHHLQASSQHLSRETYLLPNDEANAISNAMSFRNKLEHISEFLEPTPAMTIDDRYFVYTVDS